MAESYPTLLAGQRITASTLSSMLPQVARKTADTSRNSTTTLTIDPHIQLTCVPNAVYVFNGWLAYDSDIAADIILGWTVPSGSLGKWTCYASGTTVISGTGAGGTQQNQTSTWGYTLRIEYSDITASRTYGGLGVGAPQSALFSGNLRVGPAGGTWGLTWCQAVSNAANTTIFTDSYVAVQRIA